MVRFGQRWHFGVIEDHMASGLVTENVTKLLECPYGLLTGNAE